MGERGIEGAHLETMFIGGLASMYGARIDQNHAARGSDMFHAPMGERLETSFDHANDIVLVTVTWIRMLNVKRLQQSYVELSVMPDMRPFVCRHDRTKMRDTSS